MSSDERSAGPDPGAGALSLPPEELVGVGKRLFIDTNVFMDTDPSRSGGVKRLFERVQGSIRAGAAPVVVPSKVIDELRRHGARSSAAALGPQHLASRKAANALVFLEAAGREGLVRNDLGDASNPYADDLFVELFAACAGRFAMALITNDITLQLRLRSLESTRSGAVSVGSLDADGAIVVSSAAALLARGATKLRRLQSLVQQGDARRQDKLEIESLSEAIPAFARACGIEAPDLVSLTARKGVVALAGSPAFRADVVFRGEDRRLDVERTPVSGDDVQVRSAGAPSTLRLGALLGEGGEGSVYEVSTSQVAKIFDREHLTEHRRAKIALLVASGIGADGICIPQATLTDDSGRFVGYIMSRAEGRVFSRSLFSPSRFTKHFPHWTKLDLVDVCISLLEKVDLLHSHNVLIGDINPKNLLVDAAKNVWLIDADSWQVDGYPCPVGTEMFSAPTLLGNSYGERLRTAEEERFAVAAMLFMIMITGQFPYARSGSSGDVRELIMAGEFAFQYQTASNRDQPAGKWKYMWSHLHPRVKSLFWNTFHKDGNRYSRRPSASEWLQAFRTYRAWLQHDAFDPMSNDVYPTRFKARAADAPFYDCEQCGTSMVGVWNEEAQKYWTPTRCHSCKEARPRCERCGRQAALRDGHCGACNRARSNVAAFRNGRSPSARPSTASRPVADLLVPDRLCTRCGLPFITHGNVAWHQKLGKPVPTTHRAAPGGRYPAECVLQQTAQSVGKPAKKASKVGCFIATAAYGGYDHRSVRVLRRWRDSRLVATPLGRLAVTAYYMLSPYLVRLVGGRRPTLRLIRLILDRLVRSLERSGISSAPYSDPAPVDHLTTPGGPHGQAHHRR